MNISSILPYVRSEIQRRFEFRRMQNVHRNSGRSFSVETLVPPGAPPTTQAQPAVERIRALREATLREKKMWDRVKLSFHEQTHERQKPLNFFKLQIELMKYISGQTMVEIGSARVRMPHLITEFNPVCCNDGHSTYHWASAQAFEVHTFDINPESKATLDRVGFPNLTACTGDGIKFLREWSGPGIDFIFLDAWDVGVPKYAEKHLEAYHAIKDKLSARHIIGIDDTDFVGDGKGKLLVPYLKSVGYTLLAEGRQTVFINFALT